MLLTVVRKDSCGQRVDKTDFGQMILQFYAEKSGKRKKKKIMILILMCKIPPKQVFYSLLAYLKYCTEFPADVTS